MAFNLGTVDKWTDADSIMDPMVMFAAKAIQLGANEGAFWNNLVAPMEAIKTQEFEVYSRTSTTSDGMITLSASASDASLTVGTAYANGLSNGDVIQIDDEIMVVDSVNRSAGTFTPYSRGYAGTTAASHAVSASFEVISQAIKDDDADEVDSFSEDTVVYKNYTQTVYAPITLTKSAAVFDRKGLENSKEFIMLLNEAMVRVAKDLARTSILGYKAAGSSAGGPSMTAGLLQQLQDTVSGTRDVLTYNASAAVSKTVLDAAMKLVTEKGSPTDMWVSPTNKAVINSFNSSITRVDINETRAGEYIDEYIYDGYMVRVRTDSNMPDDKIAIVRQEDCQAGWVVGDALKVNDVAVANDRVIKKSVAGSFGVAIGNVGSNHILITNIS